MKVKSKHNRLGNGIAIAIGVLATLLVAVVLLFVIWAPSVKTSGTSNVSVTTVPVTTIPTTMSVTTKPSPRLITISIQALKNLEVGAEHRSNDVRVNKLLDAINTRVQSVNKLEMNGACAWFHSTNPHAMRISYDIKSQTGEIFCNELHGIVSEGNVTMQKGQPMQVDSLYLLMLRTYDPLQFNSSTEEALAIGDQVIDCIRLDGKEETLWIAEQSGNPIRLKTSVKDGPVTVDFDPSPWPSTIVPTKLKVTVPRKWFGFPLDAADDPVIEFTVDPKSIQVN